MKTQRFSRKSMLAILLSIVVVAGGALFYFVLQNPEVDSNAQNGPVTTEIIELADQIPLAEEAHLAAGIAYDADSDRFFVSTDLPHSLIQTNEAHIYVMDGDLENVLRSNTIRTDGDLEGIAYLGNGTVVAAGEGGELIYLSADNDGELVEQRRVSIFDDDQAHKLGSLAYDSQNQHLYTAEKEGVKTVYQLDSSGNLLDSFLLALNSEDATNHPNALNDSYTIAGMTYADGYLYIFSEAYSTIFKVNVDTHGVEQILGVDQLPETAGITMKGDQFYFLGDLESYLPAPEIHIAAIPGR